MLGEDNEDRASMLADGFGNMAVNHGAIFSLNIVHAHVDTLRLAALATAARFGSWHCAAIVSLFLRRLFGVGILTLSVGRIEIQNTAFLLCIHPIASVPVCDVGVVFSTVFGTCLDNWWESREKAVESVPGRNGLALVALQATYVQKRVVPSFVECSFLHKSVIFTLQFFQLSTKNPILLNRDNTMKLVIGVIRPL